MRTERKADHEIGEAAAKTATGKSMSDWFKLMDKAGGVALGRRELGQLLMTEHKVDPWWSATLNCEYEIARGAMDKDGKPKGYTICATKSIKADADACFAAFASAKALDRWFGAKHTLDFKDGGSLANGDGNKAVVRKITPGKVIRYVWQDDGLTVATPVEAKFQASGAKTTVMITIDRLQTRAEADGYRRAWGEALDRLKATLEA